MRVSMGDGTTRSVHPPGQTFVSEDEYLEITGITREQSGEYECSAVNDVAVPDVRKVKVTVNCEYRGRGNGAGVGAQGPVQHSTMSPQTRRSSPTPRTRAPRWARRASCSARLRPSLWRSFSGSRRTPGEGLQRWWRTGGSHSLGVTVTEGIMWKKAGINLFWWVLN